MGLVNTKEMLEKAKKGKYAVAAFNIHNLETLQAVVIAASLEKSPLIIQTTEGTLKHAGVEYVASLAKTASDLYDIDIALHVDHCKSFDNILKCIKAGYSSVMIDASLLPYDQNVEMVKKVVEIARPLGITVEGEIGKIGGVEDDLSVAEKDAMLTEPEEAIDFYEKTKIDSIAIAIGTAHGMYKGEPKLDFERLKEVNESIPIPIVLHGASGVPDESVRRAISLGVCKVNIATELKNAMVKAIKECFEVNKDENDPRKYMGMAKDAVIEVARQKIRLCGSNGKT